MKEGTTAYLEPRVKLQDNLESWNHGLISSDELQGRLATRPSCEAETHWYRQIWSETVVGRSREWTEEQGGFICADGRLGNGRCANLSHEEIVETAAVLCLVYGKFIEVWREKEAALKSSQLTRLLLANASHEGGLFMNTYYDALC